MRLPVRSALPLWTMRQTRTKMEYRVFADESVEDLQAGNLRLIQKKDGFRFGTDAVLLADFAKEIAAEEALDLCTGTGVIPILLSHKTRIGHICALEIQNEFCDMVGRSVAMNGLTERIAITQGDLKDACLHYGKRRFGLITCNPPYMKAGTGIGNAKDSKLIARHEILCTLEDVVRVSADLLTQGGHLVMVHRPQRLAELLWAMRQYKIEPKRLRLVYPSAEKEPVLCLVDGAFGGGAELRILPPLFLKGADGGESEELKKIYGRG